MQLVSGSRSKYVTPVVLIKRYVQKRNVSWMYTWGSGHTQSVTSRLTQTLSYFCCWQKHVFCGPTTELLALFGDFLEGECKGGVADRKPIVLCPPKFCCFCTPAYIRCMIFIIWLILLERSQKIYFWLVKHHVLFCFVLFCLSNIMFCKTKKMRHA